MVREREKVLFIVNPVSGKGKTKHLADKIYKTIKGGKYQPEIVYSSRPTHANEIAKQGISSHIRKVFAVGGDGTVNEVASALVGVEATLGIIPTGSGNGFARHLRIPTDVNKAIKLLYQEKIALVDCGFINNQKFFCTAGMGFDAHVGYKFSQMEGRGFLNYVKATIKEFYRYTPQTYTLRDDDYSTTKEAFVITVANASQYGNNAYIAPDADVTDGLLDVTVISPFPKFFAPSLGIRLFNKKLGRSRYVEMFRTRQLSIERAQEGYIHFDGEPAIMDKTLDFSIQPLELKVYVP